MGSKAIWVIALLTVGFVIINGGCANVVPPSGGPRDLQPPKAIEITPPCYTNPQRHITIIFNEPISIHQQGNIFLQPNQQFKYKIKRNKLYIYIDSLADSSFLYLSLVNLVKDITEGNILKSFTCLWHTYDTLYDPQLTVIQMPNHQRITTFVALIKDSSGRRLLYYSNNGTLPKLPMGTYTLTIWEDDNNNLQIDASEQVGAKVITIPQNKKDTILIASQSKRVSVSAISPFSAQIIVNVGGWDSISLYTPHVRVGDTIITHLPDSQQQVSIRFYGVYDTVITILLPAKRDSISNIVIPTSFLKHDTALFSFVPLIFPAPVLNRTDSVSVIVQDSIRKIPVFWTSPYQALLFIKEEKHYIIPNQQFKLQWGQLANDSLRLVSGNWNQCSAFITGNRSKSPVLIKSEKFSIWIPPQSGTISFECFPPISVTIHKLQDRNNDGRWNRGNHELLIPPEYFNKLKTIKLEPGWEYKEIIK